MVLADRHDHRIERQAQDVLPADNRWAIRMKALSRLYNQGELYNLSVRKGTLTAEERYKVNEHIVQTEIMLSELPFPRIGSGCPRLPLRTMKSWMGPATPKV